MNKHIFHELNTFEKCLAHVKCVYFLNMVFSLNRSLLYTKKKNVEVFKKCYLFNMCLVRIYSVQTQAQRMYTRD